MATTSPPTATPAGIVPRLKTAYKETIERLTPERFSGKAEYVVNFFQYIAEEVEDEEEEDSESESESESDEYEDDEM